VSDSRPVAALDLGTNTFLMLIAVRDSAGELRALEDVWRTPRLGEGLAATGAISAAAHRRGLESLREFSGRLRELDVDPLRVRAVGTAVLRRASNAAEFVAAARRESRLEIEVLSEQDEARLGWLATAARGSARALAIVDVGGGSAQVAARGGALRRSIPVGAVVLTERFQPDSPGAAYSDETWRELCATAARASEVIEPEPGADVVVLGGNGANLACLESRAARFDPAPTEGWRGRAASAAAWAERLRKLDLAARLALPIEPPRAAILPAGLAVLSAVLARLDAKDFRVSGLGLRYGVARELLFGT
jgi:exopolyphosphatase/guanosine-5'-triphosphate,3'-diphosphate pyrophosphatase